MGSLMEQLKTLYGIAQQAQLTPLHMQQMQDAHSMLPFEQAHVGAETSHLGAVDATTVAESARAEAMAPYLREHTGAETAHYGIADRLASAADTRAEQMQPFNMAHVGAETKYLGEEGDALSEKGFNPQTTLWMEQQGYFPKGTTAMLMMSHLPPEQQAIMKDAQAKKEALQAAVLAQQRGGVSVKPQAQIQQESDAYRMGSPGGAPHPSQDLGQLPDYLRQLHLHLPFPFTKFNN